MAVDMEAPCGDVASPWLAACVSSRAGSHTQVSLSPKRGLGSALLFPSHSLCSAHSSGWGPGIRGGRLRPHGHVLPVSRAGWQCAWIWRKPDAFPGLQTWPATPALPRRRSHPGRQEAVRSRALFVNFWRVVVVGHIWMRSKEHNKKRESEGAGEEAGVGGRLGKTI